MIFFTHHDPVRWDSPQTKLNRPALLPPTSTEDVMHFAEIVRVAAEATFKDTQVVSNSVELSKTLKSQFANFFSSGGNRRGGTGEFVLVFRPNMNSTAKLEIWKRAGGAAWAKIRVLTIPPDRGSSE
jgi:hypothetical protein